MLCPPPPSTAATFPATTTAGAVTQLHRNQTRELHLGDHTLTTTAGHRFWEAASQTWTLATDLAPGDRLQDQNGSELTINAITTEPVDPTPIYNFAVAKHHQYHVRLPGTDHFVLVHNDSFGLNTYGLSLLPAVVDAAASSVDIEAKTKELLDKITQSLATWLGEHGADAAIGVLGGVQFISGVIQAGIGATILSGGIATGNPLAILVGGFVAFKGIDNAQAGIKTQLTGQVHQTWTYQATQWAGQKAGLSEGQAKVFAASVDVGTDFVGTGLPSAAAKGSLHLLTKAGQWGRWAASASGRVIVGAGQKIAAAGRSAGNFVVDVGRHAIRLGRQAAQSISRVATAVWKTTAEVGQQLTRRLRGQAPSPGDYRSQGVKVVKEGDWYVKSVDEQANRFMRYWGQMAIDAQAKALTRLSRVDLAPDFAFANGVLRTADTGPTLATGTGLRGYLSPVFWRSYVRGTIAMRNPLNDIRPRNMSATGIIFDPAWDPITQTIWATGLPTGVYVGVQLSDYIQQKLGYTD